MRSEQVLLELFQNLLKLKDLREVNDVPWDMYRYYEKKPLKVKLFDEESARCFQICLIKIHYFIGKLIFVILYSSLILEPQFIQWLLNMTQKVEFSILYSLLIQSILSEDVRIFKNN